jgi:hypothetical protein
VFQVYLVNQDFPDYLDFQAFQLHREIQWVLAFLVFQDFQVSR